MSVKGTPSTSKKTRKKKQKLYERFHWSQRIAHGLLVISFTVLGLTGLSQKYASSGWAQWMIARFGGIEMARQIHHGFALLLILISIYHILDIGYKIGVKHVRLTMLPGIKDIKDAFQAFAYNLGLKKNRPQTGRYTFEEKAEYWALIWGTVIMAITGFMMWNPITTTRFLPGEIIPASKAAHGGEALLAVMAIIVWHMYGVHIKRFNKSMFTGKITESEMLHEHPLELADMKAGITDQPTDQKALRRRKIIYWPIAGVLGLVMLLGVYGFVFSERTAIRTVLPISNPVPIYVPQTPTPAPTDASAGLTGPFTWDGAIGNLLSVKCQACHSSGIASKGLDLTSFASVMKGSSDGPVIIPGDATNSKLILGQEKGNHPGQLSPAELQAVIEWIQAGAPEK